MKNAAFHHLFLSHKLWLRTLPLLVFGLFLSQPAHAILKNWTSTSSTDWNNAANWSPAGVPTASDSVRITTFNTANVSINAGVTARAKNINIFGRDLTVQSGGSLILEGGLFTYGLYLSSSTVTNSGTFSIKKGFLGMDVGYSGIFNNGGIMNVGEAGSSPYSFTEEAIRLSSGGTFVNMMAGLLSITSSGNNGILVFSNSAAFTNNGIINVDVTGLHPATGNTGDGIDTRGAFVNEASGIINITNTGANGVVAKGGGNFNNKGILYINDVGNSAGTDDQHGIYGNGAFTNSGSITVNNTPRNAIIQLSDTFNNYGTILLGTTGTIGNYGLVVGPNGGNFNNQAGANLVVKSTSNGGVLLSSFGNSKLTNFSGATIVIDNVPQDGLVNYFSIMDNQGTLNIGTNGTIGHYGIRNNAALGNQFSGNITVKNAGSACILNAEDSFTANLVTVSFQNAGIITVGKSGGVPIGIQNNFDCEFTNLGCGQITTWQRISNAGLFTNNAWLLCNNTAANTNSGTFTNNGVLADPNSTFSANSFLNNDLWVTPITVCKSQPKSPALNIGGANSFTVSTTWLNGQSNAGTYSQTSNAFTAASSLNTGNYTLGFTATGNGCSFQVPIPVQVINPPTVSVSSSNGQNYVCTGGQITLQANVSANAGTITYLWSNGATTSSINVSTPGNYTVTVTQSQGNCTDVASMNISADLVPPVALCVPSLTVNLSAPTITASQVNNGSSDNCGIASMTLNKTTFDCSNLGNNTVTLTVKDTKNNTGSCNTTVTVVDDLKPTVACKNATVNLDANGNGTLAVSSVNNGSTDNCGIASMTLSKTEFDCANVGNNGVTLTVADASGNQNTCTATIKVEDNILPTITCNNIILSLDPITGTATPTVAQVNGGSSDNCGIKDYVFFPNSYDCSDVGTTDTYLLGVLDMSSNTKTCNGTVTIADETKPVAVCQNVTVTLNQNGTATISAADVDNGSNDNCGIASKTLNKTTFDCSNSGNNTVILTVKDASNNASSCTATVMVIDDVKPTAICQNVTVQLDASGSATTSAAAVNNGSSDNCGNISMTLSKTSFDCSNMGANTVTLTVTDGLNISTCTATVNVVDNLPPTAFCKNVSVQLDINGNATIPVAAVNNGSSDNCGITTMTLNTSTFSCTNLGANTVSLTVKDASNNASSCTAVVTVADNLPPTAICKNVTAQLNANGSSTITATAVNNGSTDNCGIASMTLNNSTFGCQNIGANTVSLTVKDASNNTSSCAAIVTVVDVLPPTAICKNVIVQLDASGSGTTTAAAVNNGSSDNCSIASMTLNKTSFDCSNVGPNTVALTVKDGSNNAGTCSATVTVQDLVKPTALCKNISVTLNPSTGTTILTPADVDNGSTDACGIQSYLVSPNTFSCADAESTKTYTLEVTDVNGNSSSCSGTVFIESYPINVTLPTCQTAYYGYGPASCVNIASTVTGGSAPYNYFWSNGATTPSIQYCATTPDSPVSFTLGVTDVYGCKSKTSASTIVQVQNVICGASGTVSVCHNGTTLCLTPALVAVHLAHGDKLGSCGAPNPCTGGVSIVGHFDDEIEHTQSDDDAFLHNKSDGLHAYPNPANGYVILDVKAFESKRANIKLTNLLGSTVMARAFDALPYESIELSLSDVKEGIYWLTVEVEGKRSISQKLVVAKL